MNTKTRLDLNDAMFETIYKMSEGNPGAITVLSQVLSEGGRIDPDNAFGPLGIIMGLDSNGIYGSDIWVLYKDICGQDITNFVAVDRAIQLGFISGKDVLSAIKTRSVKIDVDDLLSKVEKRLPLFGG